jgi:hypothetical protein
MEGSAARRIVNRMAAKIETWLDDDRRFIRQRVVGDMDGDGFRRLDDETVKLADKLRDPKHVKILFDASESGKASFQARRAMVQTLKRPLLDRLAVFGANPVGRLMMRFILMVSGEKKIRFFDDERQAIEWLVS